jgi:hypothetical protein
MRWSKQLFDETDNHRLIISKLLFRRYSTQWIKIYYLDNFGTEKTQKVFYRFIPRGDLRKVIALLRESNVQIKNDEIYLHLS